jgi:hypothetical protein
MRFGAAQAMKRRVPPPDEPAVRVPAAEQERVLEIQHEIVSNIAAMGVRVIGDLGTLLELPTEEPDGAGAGPDVPIPPDVAATMALGLLEATGAIRMAKISRGPFRFAEPIEVARVPTYQLFGTLASRSWRAVVGPFVPRSRPGSAESDDEPEGDEV